MLEEWFLAFAAAPVVYGALYLLVTVDGFFPPVPSESLVIALAAVAMSTGAPNLWVIVAVAAVGAFTGDQIAYAIGRRVPVRRVRVLRSRRAQRTLDRAEHALAHRGASFIIGARYIPVGRVAVNMTAGAVGFSRLRFLGLTAIAAVSWAFYSVAIGIGAGVWLHDRPVVAVLVGVVGGAAIGLAVDAVLSRVHGRPRERRLGVEPAPGGPTAQAPTEPGSPVGPGSTSLDAADRAGAVRAHVARDDAERDDAERDDAGRDDAGRDDGGRDDVGVGDVALVTGGGARRPAAAVLLPGAERP